MPVVGFASHQPSNLGSRADLLHAHVHTTDRVSTEHHVNCLLGEKTAVNKTDNVPLHHHFGGLEV